MTTTLTLGQIIKVFRNHIGISQLDLELKINAAAGSISRMETNKINPTKETLTKISKALDLTNYEMGMLYQYPDITTESLNILQTDLDSTINININKLKQFLTSELLTHINKSHNHVTSFFLKASHYTRKIQLQLHSISNSPFKIRMQGKYTHMSFILSDSKNNLLAHAIQTKQCMFHPNIAKFLIPPFTLSSITLIQKLFNINSILAIPLFIDNDIFLGITIIALKTSLKKLSDLEEQNLTKLQETLAREINKIMKLNISVYN